MEDEPLIMMDVIDILYAAGFRTVEAKSAAEAIAILNSRDDVAVVFTDIQIVGEPDGLELAHIVRGRWPPMGLVLTSGCISPAESDLPVGGTFIAKPYSPQALVNQLRSLLN
ncbi:response regulator [Bradyrhizobium sp. ma5]|uniref:response regulator n=1 Tax=Bradyrhizobium sp. ma5 TaxID=3344828 RepID=UPI0035D4CBA6